MKWLLDVDALVAEGLITEDRAEDLRRRAKRDMTVMAIDLLLFAGMVAVIAGTSYWLDDAARIAVFGLALTVLGILTLARASVEFGLVANATAVVGASMFLIGTVIRIGTISPREILVIGLGVVVAAAGHALWRAGSTRTRFVAGCLMVLGMLAHLHGVLSAEIDPGLAPIVVLYAALPLILCGIVLDVRFITALAILPLSGALSARTFYGTGVYGFLNEEPTLTIVFLGALGALCLFLAVRIKERLGRHAGILGIMCLLAVNMAFWIGSIWGDVVGLSLWGPDWKSVAAPLNGEEAWRAWEAARDEFSRDALGVPADAFAAIWAAVLVGVAVWAAMSGRRGPFNMAVVFGAIHLYTQYFERLQATPGTIAVAGTIAILMSWGLWRYNATSTATRSAA